MIEIKLCSKWYGATQVRDDGSTQVAQGEVVVVCGPSGSGKSTLIKTVNGLEPFQKGEIFVDGVSVGAPDTNLPRLPARIVLVFQRLSLFSHFSLTQNPLMAEVKVLGAGHAEEDNQVSRLLEGE